MDSSESAWLVTSAHVVQGDPSPEVEFRTSPADPKRATVRYPQFDSSYGDRGLAILVVANPPAGVRTLAAGTADGSLLDQVVVVGYPASNNGMFTAAKTDVGSADSAEIVVNTYTDDGFSGGPVLREFAVSGMIFGQRPGKGVALPTDVIQSYLKGKVTWGNLPSIHPSEELINYSIIFQGGSPNPTRGSFTFDTVTRVFTSFSVTWRGVTFDFMPNANRPVSQNGCPLLDAAALFSVLTGGGRCNGLPLSNTWRVYPPNPVGNVNTYSLAFQLFTSTSAGYVISGPNPDTSFIASPTSGTFRLALVAK